MSKKYFNPAPLGRVTGMKTISWIWTTRIIPFKGPCKVYGQIFALL